MEERDTLILGALLHDVGKLIQRADDQPTRMTHQEFGAKWLREKGIPESIASVVERHHLLKKVDPRYEALDAGVSRRTLVVAQADWLSAAERPDKEVLSDEKGQWRADVPLLSVFSKIQFEPRPMSAYYIEPASLSSKISYPQSNVTLDKQTYKECLRKFEADFDLIKDALTPDNILVLLEKHLSCIPSETRIVEGKIESYPDISLFDHLKTTAAIANVIDLYLAENYPQEYQRDEILQDQILDDSDSKFLLVGGDFSGVQKFIYTISSRGALKTLRARSFFLELLTEHVITEILGKLRLTRANVVYSGGGRFYILAPNTKTAIEEINEIQRGINDWLLSEFRGKLYLAMGMTEFSGRDFQPGEISKIWSQVGTRIAEAKGRRFKDQVAKLLEPQEPSLPLEVCCVCQRDDVENLEPLQEREPENRVCPFCKRLFDLGDRLVGAKFIGSTGDPALAKYPIEIKTSDGTELYYVPLKKREEGFDAFYVINNWDLKEYRSPNSFPILIGNYVRKVGELPKHARVSEMKEATASFKELASASRGADRIGVLRMDVDRLGKIFVSGFEEKLRTFSRLASLSRQLTLFFKHYINSICEAELGEEIQPLDLSEKSPLANKGRNLCIVYSGGDDLFLVGAWDEITEIAFDIKRCFKRYTCDNPDVNISGGVVIQKENYPLYLLADLAREAEELAKELAKEEGRSQITLFYNPALREKRSGAKYRIKQTFEWDKVDIEVLEFMRIFKDQAELKAGENRFEPKFAHGFLYRLFAIFEQWEREGVMYLPRMAYTLQRLQESLSREGETPELTRLRSILMDRERIMNLRTPLIWFELLSRKGERPTK